MDRINEMPQFAGATKVFIPEDNMGNEATHMANMLKSYPDVRTYWQRQDRPGILKTASTADDYQFLMNAKLKDCSVFMLNHLFTTSRGKTADGMKAMLREQMERYHYEIAEPHSVHGRPKQTITGKGGGAQDDLMIAVLMALYWGRVALRDSRRIL